MSSTDLHVGFTGTRHGMSQLQTARVFAVIAAIKARSFGIPTGGVAPNGDRWTVRIPVGALLADPFVVVGHHGDCVGSDAEFHRMCKVAGFRVEIHPGHYADATMRADGSRDVRAHCDVGDGDVVHDSLPHMKRNKAIVVVSRLVIATPLSMDNQQGGTWKTIGMARKASRALVIVAPDGTVIHERCAPGLLLEVVS